MAFESDRFIEFSAPRGTIIAEDTRGLHKGKHVTRNDRLIFQLEFSNSLFGSYYSKYDINAFLNEDFAGKLKKYSKIYQIFSENKK
jgi:hypothetical protein